MRLILVSFLISMLPFCLSPALAEDSSIWGTETGVMIGQGIGDSGAAAGPPWSYEFNGGQGFLESVSVAEDSRGYADTFVELDSSGFTHTLSSYILLNDQGNTVATSEALAITKYTYNGVQPKTFMLHVNLNGYIHDPFNNYTNAKADIYIFESDNFYFTGDFSGLGESGVGIKTETSLSSDGGQVNASDVLFFTVEPGETFYLFEKLMGRAAFADSRVDVVLKSMFMNSSGLVVNTDGSGSETEDWSFVHIADPQLGNPNVKSNRWFCATLNQINRYSPTPEFILISGDIADYAWVRIKGIRVPAFWNYMAFNEAIESLKPELRDKVYIVPGNHDGYVYKLFPPLNDYFEHFYDFTSNYRPEQAVDIGDGVNYKFNYRNFQFAGFDSMDGNITKGEFETLLGELDTNTPKVLFLHHPPVLQDEGLFGWRESFVDYCTTTGNNVQIILVGHEHANEILNSSGNVIDADTDDYPQFVQTSSASNAWWFEDTPSYRIIKMKNGKAYPQNPKEAVVLSAPITSLSVALYSPANIHVYDEIGNHVGITDTGVVDRSIPDSFYFSHKDVPVEIEEKFPEEVYIFNPNSSYVYQVIGREVGTYRLEIKVYVGDEEIIVAYAQNIPTLPGAIHKYILNWDLLVQGGDGVTVEVDRDGDGNYEKIIISDNELTAEEFNNQPIANAGSHQTVFVGQSCLAQVTLNGSESTDFDGDELTYNWLLDGEQICTGVNCTVGVPLGIHNIHLIVNDGMEDSAPDPVVVTVVDEIPPNLIVPSDLIVECEGTFSQAVSIGTAKATDNCCEVDITNDSPSLFEIGDTIVTWIATDCHGNSTTATQTITLQDTTPPDISLSLSPNILWPPNHKMWVVTPTILTDDVCCGSDVTVELIRVKMNEGKTESTFDPSYDVNQNTGYAGNDIQIVDGKIYLRAERSGKSDGRIYTITYKATDCAGNSSTESETVTVPHDQGRRSHRAKPNHRWSGFSR